MEVNIKKSATHLTVNMSALVDIAFQLIIFFVIVSRFDSPNRELPVTLPKAAAAVPLTAIPDALLISITKEGLIAVTADLEGKVLRDQKTDVTLAQLEQILRQVAADNDTRTPVKIRADEACRWQRVIDVMNSCRVVGLSNYDFQTDNLPE